jgi:RNA polymerase sigma-70 factor (ECF subfamily)
MSLNASNIPAKDFNTKLRSGDIDAFEFLFRNYYSRLYAYVRTFVNNDLFAEDLVQGVFTSLWVKRAEIDEEKSISAYLMKNAKNACLDHLRHQMVKEKYIVEAKGTETQQLYYYDFLGSKSENNIEEDLKKAIEVAIENMPEKCKIVFRMRWFEGLKNREISEKLIISTTMVEKHLAKGISILKSQFKKEYYLFLIFLLTKID